jgi:NAD(P)H-hydrate epimerase
MSPPFTLTRAQSRAVDRIAVGKYGIPSIVLMENAGRGVVDVLLRIDPGLTTAVSPAPSPSEGRAGEGGEAGTRDNMSPHQRKGNPRVVILCGKGNNAGDGFVVARHLEIRRVAAKVLLLCPPADLAGDARINYDILVRAGTPIVDLSSAPEDSGPSLADSLDQHARDAAWLVDAMLGTGATGPPREPLRTAIEWINAQGARRLAIDVPSGLDCDSGEAPGEAVQADVTCTFVSAKPGYLKPGAARYVGELRVVSIGIPPRIAQEAAAP